MRRQEFLLKLFLAMEEDKEILHRHFDHQLRLLEQTLHEYRQLEKHLENLSLEKFPRKPFWIKTLKVGIAHTELDISLIKSSK